ncbi:hypothetical protein LXL04_000166 [Taraxacum kok-saghyz]
MERFRKESFAMNAGPRALCSSHSLGKLKNGPMSLVITPLLFDQLTSSDLVNDGNSSKLCIMNGDDDDDDGNSWFVAKVLKPHSLSLGSAYYIPRINDSPAFHNHCLDPLAQPRSAPFLLHACTLPPIPFQMARNLIEFLCTLAQPRNLIDFPLYIYPFEDRGCREIRFRACGIDQRAGLPISNGDETQTIFQPWVRIGIVSWQGNSEGISKYMMQPMFAAMAFLHPVLSDSDLPSQTIHVRILAGQLRRHLRLDDATDVCSHAVLRSPSNEGYGKAKSKFTNTSREHPKIMYGFVAFQKKVVVPCYSESSECRLTFNHFSDILGILRGLESSTAVNGCAPNFMPPLNGSLGVLITC